MADKAMEEVLLDGERLEEAAAGARARGTEHDAAVVRAVLGHHAMVAKGASCRKGERAAVHSCMKQVRKRVGAATARRPLRVAPAVAPGPASFAVWLAEHPGKERLRPIGKCKRILQGIAKWDLKWMDGPHTVNYERAADRVREERPGCGGRPREEFTRRLVRGTELGTAVASPGDHRVLLRPGRRPRFFTVEEESRAMGVPAASSLMRALLGSAGTAREAVTWLGRGIHVGVARCIVRELVARGWLERGVRYGSAYSGIDTFAAALEAELEGEFEYVFASESEAKQRQALVEAWGGHGLSAKRVHTDAEGREAVGEEEVGLWVATADCGKHSRRNHGREVADQLGSVAGIGASLRYVQAKRPAVVVVENVCEASIVGPLGSMLRRLDGYEWEDGALDALTTAREPVSRERHFWIGRRVGR